MRLIVNADDFGYSEDTVRATIQCFEGGAITSASLMPKMPSTAAALAFAKGHAEFSFGVHLTFCGGGGETSVANATEIPSLAGPDGRFHKTNRLRLAAIFGLLPVAQIERELASQLSVVADYGIALSHVDSHRHLHKYPPFLEALKRTLPRFGIRRVRNVQDVYVRAAWWGPTYWLGRAWRRGLEASFVTTSHFYMPASTGDTQWGPAILRRLDNAALAAHTLEIGVHPGEAEEWRKREREDVLDFARAARTRGHTLIPWTSVCPDQAPGGRV